MTWERTAAVQSPAPPAGVWDVLIDGRRWARWHDGVEWMVTEGPLEPGTVVTIKPRRLPQTALRIEVAVPARALGLMVTIGPVARMRLRWDLAPDGAGTAIGQTISIDGPLAGLLLRRAAERIAAAMPANLARLAARADGDEKSATGDRPRSDSIG
ncbi:MAG TPA: SRPBCC family protein [Candidatus Elarobacter sp.]|jgi:hypothetical protein|nr:SRPBCC family protein [Candidatus Elarobacter sp.]